MFVAAMGNVNHSLTLIDMWLTGSREAAVRRDKCGEKRTLYSASERGGRFKNGFSKRNSCLDKEQFPLEVIVSVNADRNAFLTSNLILVVSLTTLLRIISF